MKYILPILLLAGCTSLDDLYAERRACLDQNLECDDVHEQIDMLERALELREYQNVNRCPDGMIEYCDDTMRGCGRMRKRPTDEFACIERERLNDLMRF